MKPLLSPHRAHALLSAPLGGQPCLRKGLPRAPARRGPFPAPDAAAGFSRRTWRKPAPRRAWHRTCGGRALGPALRPAGGGGRSGKRPAEVPAPRPRARPGPARRPRPTWWSWTCRWRDRARARCLVPGSTPSCPPRLLRDGLRPLRGSSFLCTASSMQTGPGIFVACLWASQGEPWLAGRGQQRRRRRAAPGPERLEQVGVLQGVMGGAPRTGTATLTRLSPCSGEREKQGV